MIYSDGLATESFLPGPQTTGSFEAEVVAEIRSLFPQIDMQTGQGYSRSARPALKAYEAGLLRAGAGATQTQTQTQTQAYAQTGRKTETGTQARASPTTSGSRNYGHENRE